MSERDGSFLSRWSRRKAQVREDPALRDEAASPVPVPVPLPTTTPGQSCAAAGPPTAAPAAASTRTMQARAATRQPAVAEPAPTIDDVAALSSQSDYTRFVARGVTPEVKNAALKKLFTDPHFNIMDGLDIYIDDYGRPDPLPVGMLRQMAQSHLLGLFDDEKKADTADASPACPGAAPAAADVPDTAALSASGAADDNRLRPRQPEAATGRTGAGPSAGQDDR